MSGQKRKAQQQLTPSIAGDIDGPELVSYSSYAIPRAAMGMVHSVLRAGYDTLRRSLSWYPISPHPVSTPTQHHTTPPRHSKSPTSARNGTQTAITSSKRQKRQKHDPIRSRSKPRETIAPGLGRLDLRGCGNEGEASKVVNNLWEPANIGFSSNNLTNLEGGPATLCSKKNGGNTSRNRHPQSPQYPPTPEPENAPLLNKSNVDGRPRSTSRSLPNSPVSLRASRSQRSDKSLSDDELSRRMHKLLGTDGEGKQPDDGNTMFTASAYYTEKRRLKAEERRIEERKAKIAEAKKRRLNRRQPNRVLVEPMGLKWEKKVEQIAGIRDYHHLVSTSQGGNPLHYKDFATVLTPRKWLNDEIINSYIEWVVDAANMAALDEARAVGEKPSTVPKFVGHLSFFFNTLVTKGPNGTERLMKRKKVPGTSLLEVDSLFLPVNSGNHWTLGVVRPIAKHIEYFDSMGGSSAFFVGHIRGWLKATLGDSYVASEWTVPRTECAIQNNGYDCGVFLCTNALCVALGLDTSCYFERDMVQQRKNIAAILINRGFKGDFAWSEMGL